MESKLNILTAIHFPIIVAGVYMFCQGFQQLLSRMLRGFQYWEIFVLVGRIGIGSGKKSAKPIYGSTLFTEREAQVYTPFGPNLSNCMQFFWEIFTQDHKILPIKNREVFTLFVKTGPILLIPSAWQSGRSCWIYGTLSVAFYYWDGNRTSNIERWRWRGL